jgi:glycosyltransferase involved in cell wall biosynthesis
MKINNKIKILIVNNNMKVGGVQKSLYNLLWTIHDEFDVTLCLFNKSGPYMNDLPSDVKVIESNGPFRYLGISQSECNSFLDIIKRGALALTCKVFGRKSALRLMLKFEHKLSGDYDCAIAYLHNGRKKSFYGGVQEYVLECVNATRKIAAVHCDYVLCGADNEDNNRLFEQFDAIMPCSEGCKKSFVSAMPHLEEKCVTVENCHRFEEIKNMANTDTVNYNTDCVNLLMVSRLSHEKGIDRAIKSAAKSYYNGHKIKLHILGDGAMKQELRSLVSELGIDELVAFYGEQSNPYRYMKNADLLLMTSYHEAAPMVIDEAVSLGLPVLTMRTTSSDEMVIDAQCGWVCENDNRSFEIALEELLKNRELLKSASLDLKNKIPEKNNDKAIASFCVAVTGNK